jgi:hypothetical protein
MAGCGEVESVVEKSKPCNCVLWSERDGANHWASLSFPWGRGDSRRAWLR